MAGTLDDPTVWLNKFINTIPLPAYAISAASNSMMEVNGLFAVEMGFESNRRINLSEDSETAFPTGKFMCRFALPAPPDAEHLESTVALRVKHCDGSIHGLMGVESRACALHPQLEPLIIGIALPHWPISPSKKAGSSAGVSGTSWHDPLHQKFSLNKPWRTLPAWLGYKTDQPCPLNDWLVRVHQDDRPGVLKEIKAALRNRRSTEFQYMILDRDGCPQRVRDALFFESDSGRFIGGILIGPGSNFSQKKIKEDVQALNLVRYLLRRNDDLRREFALALHDDIISGILILKLKLATILQTASSHDRTILAESVEELTKLSMLARSISHQTWSPVLEFCGIKEALLDLCQKLEHDSNIKCRATINKSLPRLDRLLSSSIYRLVQEAFTNVVKHSQATSVSLEVNLSDSKVIVRIRDNGTGISSRSKNGSKSFGLAGMRERTRSANGQFSINKMAGGGTEIKATFPINQPPPDTEWRQAT